MNESSIRRGIACTWLCIGFPSLVMLGSIASCTSAPQPPHHPVHPMKKHAKPEDVQRPIVTTPVLDLNTLSDLETLIPALAEKRVILIV
jgi:hypothetical protein